MVDLKEYPLSIDDLQERHFYECNNGTIVTVVSMSLGSEKCNNHRVINVANGIGSYLKSNRFRPLKNGYICIDLDTYGENEDSDMCNFFPMEEKES